MIVDPPLSRWEKRIGWAWMITGGTAAVALWLGIFGWWGILLVTIPVLLFALIAPGLFLYMGAVILPLLATRHRFRPAGWAGAALLVAALALLPPWLSARETEAGLAAAVAGDMGVRVALPRGGTLALLGLAETCDSTCIQAMRDHGVDAVLIGDGRSIDPARPATLPRLRLVPAGGRPCPPVGKTARQLDWLWSEDQERLAAAGLCAVVDSAPLASADLVQRLSFRRDGDFGPVITRMEAWARRDGRLLPILRRTHAKAEQVVLPAVYLAPVVADNGRGPAGWWRETVSRGAEIPDDLSRWWR